MKKILICMITFCLLFTGCLGLGDSRKLVDLDKKLDNKEYDYVIEKGTKYVQDNPDSSQGWCILGWAYLEKDSNEMAEECFDKSIGIDSKYDNPYVGKGVLYRRYGELGKARESYDKAIAINSKNAQAYASLLVIELLEGNYDRAVECGEKAWSFDKSLPTIPANLCVAYHYVGDTKNRDKYFEKAKKLGYDKLDVLQDIFNGKASIK